MLDADAREAAGAVGAEGDSDRGESVVTALPWGAATPALALALAACGGGSGGGAAGSSTGSSGTPVVVVAAPVTTAQSSRMLAQATMGATSAEITVVVRATANWSVSHLS